jgi:hypothetical protein
MTTLVNPRSAWQTAAQPVTGPAANRSAITDFVVHYPGTDWADLDFDNDDRITTADSVWLLRSMQSIYLRDPKRGYSLGYSFADFHGGDLWEIRGLDIRNAANKGRTGQWNPTSISVLVVVDEDDPMTPAQLSSLYELYDWCCEQLGRELRIRRHGEGDATPCPGAGITAQLAAGRPQPPPENGDPIVTTTARRIQLKGTHNRFLIGAGPPLHLTPELDKAYAELPLIEVGSHPQFARSLSAAGFTPDLIVGTWRP